MRVIKKFLSFLFKDITKIHLLNILKISTPKTENFQIKNPIFFLFPLKTLIVGRGGSSEYPQSMFISRNKKNNVYTCKFQFYYI